MAYTSIVYPTTFVRPIRTTRYALGVTRAEYSACLSAQATYSAELAAWNKNKAAYDAAVKARNATLAGQAASYAAAMAAYQAAHAAWVKRKATHDAWVAAMAGKYSGYSMAAASLLQKYPNVKLAAGAPPCVSSTVHSTYAAGCAASTLHGLGAYSWAPYNACFVAAYPVCTTDPVEPPLPGSEPQPPATPTQPAAIAPLRAQPTPPPACTPPAQAAAPVPTVVTVLPQPEPDHALPPELTEASLAPSSKASGGLLVAGLVVAAIGGIYLITRRKRAA
jgi:hypothetical protein